MSKPAALRHYQRALAQWPADILRPDMSFSATMMRRANQRFPSAASQSSSSTPTVSEEAELAQVNALYSLLENRYTKKYPLSAQTMKPASNPEYYDNLVKELREAPQRSLFGRIVNRWKGFLRFQ